LRFDASGLFLPRYQWLEGGRGRFEQQATAGVSPLLFELEGYMIEAIPSSLS
jgi:hypothetical protein